MFLYGSRLLSLCGSSTVLLLSLGIDLCLRCLLSVYGMRSLELFPCGKLDSGLPFCSKDCGVVAVWLLW